MNSETPRLSVIVASYNALKTIEACLRSLEQQRTTQSFEVIVVDSGSDGAGKLIQKHFPLVTLCNFSKRMHCGEARNVGIRIARADLIAFLDADCVADGDWIERILSSHQASDPAIGGAIDNCNPMSFIGWAAYFCEFSRWMPGSRTQWIDDIAGANMSYKKEVFDRYGTFIKGTYCSDTEFHWRMGRTGVRLLFEPTILVSHHNIDNFKQFVRHEFIHGRSFGRVHLKAKGFSSGIRVLKVLGLPLCILRILGKILFFNFRNRIYFSRFLLTMPLILLGSISWSIGQVTGYAQGAIE